MRTNTEFRQTISFRLSSSQLDLLDQYVGFFKQGRGELIREAIQNWLHKQIETHPLPKEGA